MKEKSIRLPIHTVCLLCEQPTHVYIRTQSVPYRWSGFCREHADAVQQAFGARLPEAVVRKPGRISLVVR